MARVAHEKQKKACTVKHANGYVESAVNAKLNGKAVALW
jgi:hypothetical protein